MRKLIHRPNDTIVPDAPAGLATIEEAAAFLACTPAAIRKWLAPGRLRRVKLGGLTRVLRSDLARIARDGLPGSRPRRRGDRADMLWETPR